MTVSRLHSAVVCPATILIVAAMSSTAALSSDVGAGTIVMEPVVTLRASSDLLPSSAVSVLQTVGGDFLMASRRGDKILVFNRTGALRTALVTRKKVPFAKLVSILPLADGGFVAYDGRTSELHPISRDLVVGSPTSTPYVPSLVLPTGELVSAQQIRTPQLAGFPIHLVDRMGKVTRSFGADLPEFRGNMRLLMDRIVGAGREGTIWSTARGKYVLEKWDPLQGKRLASLSVRSPWFKDSIRAERDERIRPQPILETLWEGQHCVWVVVRDADSNWRAPAKANVERPFEIGEYISTYDWILEAIDVSSGQVLASSRFSEPVWGRSVSPYFVTRNHQTPNNYDVYRPILRGRRP